MINFIVVSWATQHIGDFEMPTIAKRRHIAADPRKCLENALRVLAMVPRNDCQLVPHPLDTVRAEINQALEGLTK